MRSAALTASLLLHAGLAAAVCALRSAAPASAQRSGDGKAAPEFAFLAESGSAEVAERAERIAVVEFTPPPEQASVSVEAVVEPIVIAPSDAIAATPGGVVSAVPTSSAKSFGTARSRTFVRGSGIGAGSGGGAGYQPPRYRICPAPPYPAAARARKLEGAALLLVQIDDAGRPTRVTLRRSTGSAVLDDAAVRAVWAWRFEPARAAGRAIAASVEVPVRFRYRG